jgi:gluconate 2-dehydrogenase subunit 3-like protein
MPDYREADHLPKRRQGAQPPPPDELPRQRRGTTPQNIGRYPDYDVLEHAAHWDQATRDAVLPRVESPPPIRFFTRIEAAALRAFCDTVTAQDSEPRIPVLEHVDEKLAAGRLEGYQYADLPDDRETWRLAAQGLDEAARECGAASFAAASDADRTAICSAFKDGELRGGAWSQLNVARAWSVLLRDTLSAFYAHPWAWNEIGFGGPAYPRGYSRLGVGLSESWEGEEAFELDPVEDVQRRGVDR